MANGNKGTIRGSVRKRGGLTREERLQSRIDKAAQKMEELEVQLKSELTEGKQMLVRNYLEYVKFLDDVARGEVEATVTARMNACNTLIKKVEEIQEELELAGIDPDSLEEEELPEVTENDGKIVSLINF